MYKNTVTLVGKSAEFFTCCLWWVLGLQTVKRIERGWSTTVVGISAVCLVVIKYMPFEVRVVRIYLTVYYPGTLYISILEVIIYNIGQKFMFFHVGP